MTWNSVHRITYSTGRHDVPTDGTLPPNNSKTCNGDGTDADYLKKACTVNRPTELGDDRTRSKNCWEPEEHGLREDTAAINRTTILCLRVTKTGLENTDKTDNAPPNNRTTKNSNWGTGT